MAHHILNEASELCEEFGGVRPLARALGIPPTTVASWVERASVPKWRWSQIEAARAARRDMETVSG